MSIIPQQTKIDADEALELIGREFNFSHSKGISELLKNSYDAYLNDGIAPSDQLIIILLDVTNNDIVKGVKVVDFCGLTKKKIDEGFVEWFSKTASKLNRTGEKTMTNTLGGHGNGGKFYMRQMFGKSFLASFVNGRFNMFGFNEKKEYGYFNGFENIEADKDLIFNQLDLDFLLNINLVTEKVNNGSGITVVGGSKLQRTKSANIYKRKLIKQIINNPQARSVIRHSNVYVGINDYPEIRKLAETPIEPHPKFPGPYEITCPDELESIDGIISITNEKYKNPPKLILKTSDNPLKGPNLVKLNRIDFLGESGVIASYHLNNIGPTSSNYTEFIYGDCIVPILEDDENNHVTNDRERFIQSPLSDAIIGWVNDEIHKLSDTMSAESKKLKKAEDLSKTSELNKILNTWKNQFLKSIMKDQLFGNEDGLGKGGDVFETPVYGDKKRKVKDKKNKKKTGDKGGAQKKKSKGFSEVLISGTDPDPQFEDGRSFVCDERHHAVHQRPWDVINNVYWINTNKPLASAILDKKGSKSTAWRNYLYQRHSDIIIKEAIEEMEKRDILTADDINNKIDEIISILQEKAVSDLKEYLFNEGFEA